MSVTLDKIRSEHMSMSRVLDCLEAELAAARDAGRKSDFDLLGAIFSYIRVFPDRFHHPKEDEFLFPAILRRDPSYRPVIEQLQDEHSQGADMLDDLDRLLADAIAEGADIGADFRRAVRDYVAFERNHMRREETRIIPIAERKLDEADWAAIDAAFAANVDPLEADTVAAAFEALYRKIVIMTTAPEKNRGA